MLITKEKIILIICSVCGAILPLAFVLPMYFCTNVILGNLLSIVGVVYLGFSGLYLVTRSGMFDVFRYQFINWMSSFKKGIPLPYKDAYEYKMHLEEKRENNSYYWLPFVILGALYLIAGILFSFFPIV